MITSTSKKRFCRFIRILKGQCHEIFCFWFFSWISLPPATEYSIRTVSNFFDNSRRYSQLKACHRCQRHRWQMEKIFKQKNFNNFVCSPLGSRGNVYINFCLQVHFKLSAAWYCSHCFVRKFDGWIQKDQWATQIDGCELTVSRRASRNSSS